MRVRRELLWVGVLTLLLIPVAASADTQGPFTGTAATQSTAPTQVDWTSVGSVLASDDSRASVTLACCSELSERITISNLGFSIPSSATIDGIQVDVEKRGVGVTGSPSLSVFLYWDDGGYTWINRVISWGSTEEVLTLGGPSDTFGSTRVPSDINDENLGFRVQVQVDSESDGSGTFEIDYVTVTVFYSPVSGREKPVPSLPPIGLLVLAVLVTLLGFRLSRRHRAESA